MRTRGKRWTSRVAAAGAAAVLLLLSPILGYAILISPHAVFMDHRTRAGQVYLANTGTTPEEVEIALSYGYPVTDSAGNISVRLIDRPDSTEPSAAGWIRAFPRRAVVQPGERQVVRLLAQPPATLPDGEYWSRIIVTSRGQQMAVASADTTVRAGVSLEMRTIISVSYRKGQVRTGVEIRDLRAGIAGDSLVVWVGLVRQGNAAYLGTTRIRLYDPAGAVRGDWSTPTAVYVPVTRRYAFGLEGLAPGRHVVSVDLSTTRDDLPQGDILPANPAHNSVVVEVR